MAIKIDLKQLTALFIQSASNEELPIPIRQFAAQCSVLTRHVATEAQARKALEAKLDGQIAELANHILATRQETPTTTPSTNAPIDNATNAVEGNAEEDEAQAMADKVRQETEAEVEAIAKAPASVTPLRKSNSNQKVSVEDAS